MSGPRPWPGMPDVTVERDVGARMRDGVTLYADVYRPVTDTLLPVLLMRSPYDKRNAISPFGSAHPVWFASQGYMVVIQDSRGRASSEGEFYPYLHEMSDGYDTVEWAARLRGSDGRVGMWGFSYVGATQMLAAVERPPSLTAIAPAFTASQYYEGWTYNGGALSLAFVLYWANLLALDTAHRAGDRSAFEALGASLAEAPGWFWFAPLRDYPPLSDGYASWLYDWLDHPTYDDYWKRWSIDEDYSRITVPALHVGGLYDIFVSGTVRNFAGLRAEGGSEVARNGQKLLLGPWTHMPWSPLGASEGRPPNTIGIDNWQVRWFDQMIKGKDTGVLDSPVTVHLFNGGWRHYDDWPPSGVKHQDWFIHSGGRANSKYGDGVLSRIGPGEEPPDLFVYDPALPSPSQGGHSCCFDTITPMGPADQHASETSRMVLVYTSDPLADEMTLVGDVSVTLWAATTAGDTDWTARLCIVDEAGVSTNLQEGIIRARYRRSLSDPTPIQADRVYEYQIDLGPVAALVEAGHRLRLVLGSSDFPQWDRNMNTGGPLFAEPSTAGTPATQTVLHNISHPTRITLPVLEG